MTPLALQSATALADAVRRRTVGCRELLETYAARIDRLNAPLNAVVTLDLERARAAADAADAALRAGRVHGPFHGLPMTIKDSFETAGLRTTCGAEAWTDHVPARDADVVARVRAAGAVVVGKTNVPMHASDVQTFNRLFGTTNNPWDAARTPGGSSGGAAAAVATGMTALELGSDIGGSIRTPASWCGIYGHKPSYGIVSHRGHLPPGPGMRATPDLNVIGPLARSADDLALALDVLAGPAPEQAVGWRLALPPPRRARLRDWRIAAWLDDPACPVDAPVRARLDAVVTALRAAGCTVDEQARPDPALAAVVRTYFQILSATVLSAVPRETFDRMAAAAAARPDDDDEPTRTFRNATARHRDVLAAVETREQVRARFAKFFRSWDVLLCPVTPVPAIPHDHAPVGDRRIVVNGARVPYAELFSWIAPATFAYLPATVAPAGRTADGLPVGVQIVGPYLEDRSTIAFAKMLADVAGGFEAPPMARDA